MLLPLQVNGLNLDSGTAVAVISGTLDGSTEAEIVAGSQTTIITLTNDTWVTAGATFNAQRQAIIDGVTSAQSETTGWNNEVRDNEAVTSVVRTSDTVVTITWTAAPAYDITDGTGGETITVTVPAAALTGAVELTGTPTVSIVADTVADEEEERPSGGWGASNWYGAYRQRKRRREEELRRLREERERIQDAVDREIAGLLQKSEEEALIESSIAELEQMVSSVYTKQQARAATAYNERVGKAFVRAAVQKNFSAVQAFEREMDRAIEEEEFLMLAMLL